MELNQINLTHIISFKLNKIISFKCQTIRMLKRAVVTKLHHLPVMFGCFLKVLNAKTLANRPAENQLLK